MTGDELFGHKGFTLTLVKLWSRWQDEKCYEDFADYRLALANALPGGCSLERAWSSPFMLHVRCSDGLFEFKMNGRNGGTYSCRKLPEATTDA